MDTSHMSDVATADLQDWHIHQTVLKVYAIF